MFYVYILKTFNNRYYIGQTNNPERRLRDHFSRQGSKFCKDHPVSDIVYIEELQTREIAVEREKQLKGWSKVKKSALIKGDVEMLKALSKKKVSG